MSDAEQKFRDMGAKLKGDVEAKKEVEKQETAIALNQLAQLSQNAEMAKMYQESAQVGADNLSGELPILKVHAVGKSTKNELRDGSEPTDGYFFYKPTGEQFKDLRVHVLTISKGFRAEGMQNNGSQNKMVFNQVLGGVIISEGEMKPFVMYMTGLKLNPLWEFGKAASKYTHMKPVAIPMFALTVKMTTEKIANNYGKSWIVNFEIEKTEDGSPVLVMDPGEFQFLKDHVEMVEDTIASIITAKTVKGESDEEYVRGAEEVFTAPSQPARTVNPVPDDGIPF